MDDHKIVTDICREFSQYDWDLGIALETGNILAAKYIIKKIGLTAVIVRNSFRITLIHGHHEMASWLVIMVECYLNLFRMK